MKKEIMNGVLVFALMAMAGCSSSNNAASSGSATEQPVTSSGPAIKSGYGFDQWQQGPLGDVFFEFDSADLTPQAEQQLKDNAAWLESNPANKTTIEGHCDSRGTSEYNIALGERRSSSAKEYLVRLGIASSRLESVSYGEERPFDQGQNDEAWAKNRRDHFVVK
ncbi:MAG: peptidoglycan-associated lipoprotein Pal [Chlorobiaceae bacterium]|nr:peptidoglycan-associated lipoprotein Pal [Chlorobiaceae bacterium]NTW10570.1 peptidoglycan-associated lipoprotein Pal [Chlorobiaceae bacterium]